MKTFILACLLAVTAASGVIVASDQAEAGKGTTPVRPTNGR
jgi:hypothetical protein